MALFEVLYRMPTFKLEGGRFKAFTLVTVRLRDNRVVTILLPLPEHLVTDKDIEEELRRRRLI